MISPSASRWRRQRGGARSRSLSRVALLCGLVAALLAVARADTGSWQSLPVPSPGPLPRAGHTLSTMDGDAWIFGGQTRNPSGPGQIPLNDLWEFDGGTGTLHRISPINPTPAERYDHAATVIGSEIWFFFGIGANGEALSDVALYDHPGDCWQPGGSQGNSVPAARSKHTAVTVAGSHALVFGGLGPDHATPLNDLWDYNSAYGAWSQKTSMPAAGRYGHAAVTAGDRMCILGGVTPDGPQNDVWLYNPGADGWTQLQSDGDVSPPFSQASVAAGDFRHDGSQEILVTGGLGAAGEDLTATYAVNIDAGAGMAHWARKADGPAVSRGAAAPLSYRSSGLVFLRYGGSRGGQDLGDASVFSDAAGPPRPDLAGEWQGVIQSCKGSGKRRQCRLIATFGVRNPGQLSAPASQVAFYLSSDNSVGTGDRLLKRFTTRGLAPGQSIAVSLNVALPRGTTASGRYVIAVLDPGHKVVESNENNNTAVFGPVP